jgi:hypothetical protein
MDTRHHGPKLFRGGADGDGDHESICHLNRDSDGDRYGNANCDTHCDGN